MTKSGRGRTNSLGDIIPPIGQQRRPSQPAIVMSSLPRNPSVVVMAHDALWISCLHRQFEVKSAEATLPGNPTKRPPVMVLTLERAGVITRTPGVARSRELLVKPEDLAIPPMKPSKPLCSGTSGGCTRRSPRLPSRNARAIARLLVASQLYLREIRRSSPADRHQSWLAFGDLWS